MPGPTQNGRLAIDDNDKPVMGGTSSVDNTSIVNSAYDPITRRLLTDAASGSGTVTSVSVVSANGFAGSVATATTTPAITLTTSITGTLQGNGTAISASKVTLTQPATGSTLTIIDGKTLTINKTISLTAADDTGVYTLPTGTKTLLAIDGAGTGLSGIPYTLTGTANQVVLSAGTGNITFSLPQSIATSSGPQFATIELGNASDTTLSRSAGGVLAVEGVVIPSISSTNTLTNKRITRRLTTTNAPGATPTTNTDNVDVMNFTGLGTAITSMTTNLSGTPVDGDLLEIRFTDDGTGRGITWGASFASTTVTLPTTTVSSTMLRVGLEWSGSTWNCIAKA